MSANVTLYLGAGTGFDSNWAAATPSEQAAIQQQIESTVTELSKLPWNVYILAFLHVHAQTLPMQLVYNGTPVASLYPGLGAELAKLKAAGKRLLISIGGWDNACDFSGIQTVGVAAFLTQAQQQVIGPLGLDGIDLDLEPTQDSGYYCPVEPSWNGVYEKYSPVLVELSNQAAAAGLVVSHAPAMYMDSTYYTGPNGILVGTKQGTGNSIAFLNYQTYGEGTNLAPTFEAFVGQIDSASTGIANPAEFVCAGFGIADGLNDNVVVAGQGIVQLRQTYGEIGGAFVWRFTASQTQMALWATTLSAALAES